MKSTSEQLAKAISEIQKHIPPGSVWKHYKGGVYRVNDHVIDTDDGKVRVLYFRIAGPDFSPMHESAIAFVRPAEEWFTDAEVEPKVFVPRFQKVHRVERWHTEEELKELRG